MSNLKSTNQTVISSKQARILSQKYQIEAYPRTSEIQQIADEVGLPKLVVQRWFSNARRPRKTEIVSVTNAPILSREGLQNLAQQAKDEYRKRNVKGVEVVRVYPSPLKPVVHPQFFKCDKCPSIFKDQKFFHQHWTVYHSKFQPPSFKNVDLY